MSDWMSAVGLAFWLGIMTSVSPCPLASNIAAISYIGKSLSHPNRVMIAGTLYTAGRILCYILLASVILGSLLSIPKVSHFLQKYMNQLLGPVLIIAGMFLLELISIDLAKLSFINRENLENKKYRIGSSLFLGFIFALSFCPVSAALFFGSLVPLSIKNQSFFVIPAFYGIGTGLPVFVFAVLIASGTRSLGIAFNRVSQFERWFRMATGIIFIVIGIYFSLAYIFHINFSN